MAKKRQYGQFFASWVLREFVADYVFKEFLYIIKNNIQEINLVDELCEPDTEESLYGYTEIENKNKFLIYLDNGLNKEALLKVFLHELAHCLLAKIGKNIHPIIEEIRVLQAERILYQCFSKKQKEQLRRYLPKTISEKKPKK
ncbi:MAG: hypothetical protein AAB454_01545 [Patescibacteria group bacterium]|mgnify:CR=1 FL=1